jgi:hypothetical protein
VSIVVAARAHRDRRDVDRRPWPALATATTHQDHGALSDVSSVRHARWAEASRRARSILALRRRRVSRSRSSQQPPSTWAPVGPAALLDALVERVADAVLERMRAEGLVLTSGSGASTWYSQDSSPIARRTYLRICRSGEVPSRRVGKVVLVERRVLDAWIAANGAPPRVPTPTPSSAPDAPTDAELMRKAGFVRVAKVAACPQGRRR